MLDHLASGRAWCDVLEPRGTVTAERVVDVDPNAVENIRGYTRPKRPA